MAEYIEKEAKRLLKAAVEDLKHLARNPTGFRRWDEWLGVFIIE